MNHHIEHFDSLEALVNTYKASGTSYVGFTEVKVSTTLGKALHGDISLVPRAESLLEQLNVNLESIDSIWEPAVLGPLVSVPSYLANVPTTFRKLQPTITESAPLKIFAGIASSAAVSAEILQTRGVTIMALVLMLQKVRPVEVILYSEHGSQQGFNILYTIKLESNPISLAHCINGLADPYLARHLTFGLAWQHGWVGSWPREYHTEGYKIWRNEVLNVQPNDIVLESSYAGTEIVTDPVGWINSHLGKVEAEI